MNVDIVCVGRALRAHEQAWIDDYEKRIHKFSRFSITRIKESSRDDISKSQSSTWLKIKSHFPAPSLKIALDPRGKSVSTEELRGIFDLAVDRHKSNLVFVVGGSYGFPEGFERDVDQLIALGRITLPHRIALLTLVEQVYRVLSWKAGAPYHHE